MDGPKEKQLDDPEEGNWTVMRAESRRSKRIAMDKRLKVVGLKAQLLKPYFAQNKIIKVQI